MNKYKIALYSTQDQIIDSIRMTPIIEYGFITEVIDNKFVKVQLCCEDTQIVCTLLSFSTKNLLIKPEVNVNDHCLVFFPKKYHKDMYEATEFIDNKYISGYNYLTGMCFPLNITTIENKDQKGKLSIQEDGTILFTNENTSFKLTSTSLSYTNGKGSIEMDENGKVSINSHLTIEV